MDQHTVSRSFFFFARAGAHAFGDMVKHSVNSTNFSIAILALSVAFIAPIADAKLQTQLDAITLQAVQRKPNADVLLMNQFKTESDSTVRARIIDGIAELDGTNSYKFFVLALGDKDALVRLEAVQALGRFCGNKPVQVLQDTLLNDANEGVRLASAFWLGSMKDAKAVSALSEALQYDNDPHVRAQAARSLHWIGTREAKAQVHQAADDEDSRVSKIANEP